MLQRLVHFFSLTLLATALQLVCGGLTATEPSHAACAIAADATQSSSGKRMAEMTSWVFDGGSDLPEVPEPSGMCYVPERNTLFLVDDGAQDRAPGVYEIDLQGGFLQGGKLGQDLEGICYCPADKLLYACDESGEQVYRVSLDEPQVLATFGISRTWQGEELLQAGGNGFEGIEYIEDDGSGGGDYFILLNQDDPTCLVRVDRAALDAAGGGEVPLAGAWELAQVNAGELYYDSSARELWVVHSWVNVMEVLSVPAMETLRWEVFPGCAQEAVAVDGDGRLWVGYDSGGIARYIRKVDGQ